MFLLANSSLLNVRKPFLARRHTPRGLRQVLNFDNIPDGPHWGFPKLGVPFWGVLITWKLPDIFHELALIHLVTATDINCC